jgi:hypothetical protein
MPLYDETDGCYRFFSYTVRFQISSKQSNSEKVTVGAAIVFTNAKAWELLAQDGNAGIKVKFSFDWGKQTITYVYSAANLTEFAVKHSAMVFSLTGIDTLAAGTVITASVEISSVTGVMAQGLNDLTYTTPAVVAAE